MGCNDRLTLRVLVESGEWGDALTTNIARLLENAASHLNSDLRQPFEGNIHVMVAPLNDPTPRTLVKYSTTTDLFVQLTAKDRKWSQYAYQFSHEFCHLLVEPYAQRSGPNAWFEESLCEMCSIYALRRMAEQWTHDPPYENWATYAPHLASYANDWLGDRKHQLPAGMDICEWVASHEHELRTNPLRRDKNGVVAQALLPLFEQYPSGWNAVRALPVVRDSSNVDDLRTHIRVWQSAVDARDRQFVDELHQTLTVPE